MISALAKHLMAQIGSFEVCIHIDGSTDDSEDQLALLKSPKLKVSTSHNEGRAGALRRAVEASRGRFIMLFDDDDWLEADGLAAVLRDCATRLEDDVAGFVYHLSDESGAQLGTSFPAARSNFLKMRADDRVTCDKKEVVRASILRPVMGFDTRRYRRIPTSLFWSKIALSHDVLCRNLSIGRKTYHAGGMSDTLAGLKRRDPKPMFSLHLTRLNGFWKRRYRSPAFAARSMIAAILYGSRSAFSAFGR